jgi:hypothetical protein
VGAAVDTGGVGAAAGGLECDEKRARKSAAASDGASAGAADGGVVEMVFVLVEVGAPPFRIMVGMKRAAGCDIFITVLT